MVVAQLAERSLPTPEIRSLNPNIGNILIVFFCQLLSRKDQNKEKEAGNGPFKKVNGVCESVNTRIVASKSTLNHQAIEIGNEVLHDSIPIPIPISSCA